MAIVSAQQPAPLFPLDAFELRYALDNTLPENHKYNARPQEEFLGRPAIIREAFVRFIGEGLMIPAKCAKNDSTDSRDCEPGEARISFHLFAISVNKIPI